jgi:Raf kinase inhibitor-like YbhB/YbcL family protein
MAPTRFTPPISGPRASRSPAFWCKTFAVLVTATAVFGLAAAGRAASLKLTSTAFKEGGTIPKEYTGDGKDVSPPLRWSGAPKGTKTFALICDDPDAPKKTWVHWVIFNLPADQRELKKGMSSGKELSGGVRQGTNDSRRTGYGGPYPPKGKPHRYFFKLYALDTKLDLKAGATKSHLLAAMKGHILAEAKLMGKYKR